MECFGVILWIVLAVLVGKYSESKGGGFVTGLLVSILCSPLIGALVVMLTPKNKQALEKIALSDGDVKKCPACAELVKKEAVKCRFCGQDFAA